LPRLRSASKDAHDTALEQRQSELARERPRDLTRLIVAALATSRPVQRHGHERVDVGAHHRERRREQQRERAAERPRASVFERVQVVVERRRVVERRDDGRDGPGSAAHRATGDGLREPAAHARGGHARERRGAHGAEAASRGEAAGRAAFDEQRVPHPVNQSQEPKLTVLAGVSDTAQRPAARAPKRAKNVGSRTRNEA
jgi:hypothetical protein